MPRPSTPAFLLLVFFAACSGGGGSTGDAEEDGAEETVQEPVPDAEEAADQPSDGRPEESAVDPDAGDPDAGDADAADAAEEMEEEDGEAAPAPEFPIIFVHGHDGGLEDWRATIEWLIEEDPRWSGTMESGTQDAGEWEAGSVPPGSWLFNFTYYNLQAADAQGDFTAGPGRIGSNGTSWCARYDGWGHLPANSPRYDRGVDHEYAADFDVFVDRVLGATGAERVDIVAHSMGGLVSRSFIQFFRGFERVRTLVLVSSPIHGLSLADFAPLDPTRPDWMNNHEFAELDDIVSFWDIGFRNCAVEDSPVIAWHTGLNETDDEAAAAVAYHVVVGAEDPYLTPESVAYDHAPEPVVIPGADHTTVRSDPVLRAMIAELLGN